MNTAFLLAAGKSKRFGEDKLFALVKGKPVIYYSLKFLEDSEEIAEIYIAANKRNKKKIEDLVRAERFKKVKKIVLGGKSRFDSVFKLITNYWLPITGYYLIIHNAANPLAQAEELKRCLAFLNKNKNISGVAVGRKITASVKKTKSTSVLVQHDDRYKNVHQIEVTLPRENLWEMETPQVVRMKDFLDACRSVMVREPHHDTVTDDLAVLESAGYKTAVVSASPYNKKITTKEDLEMLRFFAGDLPSEYRVGIGEDSHAFVTPRAGLRRVNAKKSKCLILGGVEIKNMPKPEADSDGDVIIHALCNAIMSAIGEGSLGTYATKMCKQGIRDSKKYLEKVLRKMRKKKFKVHNCSISISAEQPKIDPLAPLIKKKLSALLNIQEHKIGITAISGGEGIRCSVSVLLGRSTVLQ